jgi:hypothetical protein
MKIRVNQFTVASLAFVFTQAVFAQGFQNLDFEAATISSAPLGYTPAGASGPISAADALPGWTVYEDNTLCTAVWGIPGLAITFVSLDQGSAFGYHTALEGNYSVGLSANNVAPGYYTSASIAQTGIIPDGMQSIQFLLQNLNFPPPDFPPDGNLFVTLNGTQIPVSVISTSGYTMTMAGDISTFAGTTAELKLAVSAVANYTLDSITFSSAGVPEPSAFGLVGLGLLGLGWHRRRNHRT